MKEIAPKAKRPVGRPRMGKVKVMIAIDPEIKTWLDHYCQINGATRSGIIEDLIRSLIEKKSRDRKPLGLK